MFRIRNLSKTKLWVKITVLGVPLALIGCLAWVFIVTPAFWCGSDVRRVEDQCIGVTDGQVVLTPGLAEVLDQIRRENERVERDHPGAAVSVAYLVPLPKESGSPNLAGDQRLRHELEGAHIAQLRANRTDKLGGPPPIRLLVANYGDHSSHWQRVVPVLLAKVNEPDRLVAVVATGDTVSATLEAIKALRSGGLPVVLSRLGGDSLLDEEEQVNPLGGLARLAPSGSDQGAATAAYLKPTASRALVVRDTNPDDPYLRAFDEAFRRTFPDDTHTVLEPPETYDSRLAGVANAMQGILRNICLQKPDVVFFAGRAPALDAFVQALPGRPCLELPINVMAPGSTAGFTAEVAEGNAALTDGLNANASVRYTTQAHPAAWAASPESFHQDSMDALIATCEFCFTSVFRGETLEDGGGIVGYDATLITVTAIRPDQQGSAINQTPELVSQEFTRLHGADAVPGAAGWVSLDQHGNPVNKAVVILQVKPDGSLEFLKLSSPRGTPCVPATPPC